MAKIIIPENPNEYREWNERLLRVPITNQQIINKVGFGSTGKKIGEDNQFYYFLYKTTYPVDGMIFVSGCMSNVDPDQDKSKSPGIPGRKPYEKYAKGRICLQNHVRGQEKKKLLREDLLFFDSLKDLLKAEALILDQDFQVDSRTLNHHFNFDYEGIAKKEYFRLHDSFPTNDKDLVKSLLNGTISSVVA